MNTKLLEHLQSRPIAPIVNGSKETTNLSALKVLCILDHQLEVNELYPEMNEMPKLMGQLLRFHSFGSFRYIHYKLPKHVNVDDKILKCKQCELIGSYPLMLNHMTINHNIHISAAQCLWCEKATLQNHLEENSLDRCYENYLEKQQFSSIKYPNVFEKFYNLLKKIAQKLGVKVARKEDFKNARTVKRFETIRLDQSDDSMSNRIVIYNSQKYPYKYFNVTVLDSMCQDAMKFFHHENAHQFLENIIATNRSSMTNTLTRQPSISKQSEPNQSTDDDTRYDPPKSTSFFDMPNLSSMDFAQTQSSQPQSMPEYPSMSIFGAPTYEFGFGHFISSVISNIHDETLKKRAKLEVQQIVFKYSGEDIMKQMSQDK